MFRRLDERLKKERLGHVEFQSFVCWMLFICAVLALMIPTGLVVNEARDFGCIGEEFTIVAHYGSVGWMQEMFEDVSSKKKIVEKNTFFFEEKHPKFLNSSKFMQLIHYEKKVLISKFVID